MGYYTHGSCGVISFNNDGVPSCSGGANRGDSQGGWGDSREDSREDSSRDSRDNGLGNGRYDRSGNNGDGRAYSDNSAVRNEANNIRGWNSLGGLMHYTSRDQDKVIHDMTVLHNDGYLSPHGIELLEILKKYPITAFGDVAAEILIARAKQAAHYGFYDVSPINWNGGEAMERAVREWFPSWVESNKESKSNIGSVENYMEYLSNSHIVPPKGAYLRWAIRDYANAHKANTIKEFIEQQKAIEAQNIFNALPEIEKRQITAQHAQNEVDRLQKLIDTYKGGSTVERKATKQIMLMFFPEAKAKKEAADKAVREELERLAQEAQFKDIDDKEVKIKAEEALKKEQKDAYVAYMQDKFIQEKGMEILEDLLKSEIEEKIVKALMAIPSPWGAIQIAGGIFILSNKAIDIKELPLKVQNIINEYNAITEESNNLNSNDPKILQYLEDKKCLDESFQQMESELHIPQEWLHHDEF